MYKILLRGGKAVPLVLSRRWLRGGGSSFQPGYVSREERTLQACVFVPLSVCNELNLDGCPSPFFFLFFFLLSTSRVLLRSAVDKNWCGHISGGSFNSPWGCRRRCIAKHSSKTLQTSFYLSNSGILYILCYCTSSICAGFSEVELFDTFLGIKMKSDHFCVWKPTDVGGAYT